MTVNVWPRVLPLAVRKDPFRSGEVKVYERFTAALPDEFHLFYSSPWLGTDSRGNEIDGECDFTIAHRTLGLLAIEVKGGRIAYEPERDRWSSTNRADIESTVKNPIEQARGSKHQLVTKLRKMAALRQTFVPAAHGVIFPDCDAPVGALGADRPRELFCCREQLRDDPEGWVRARMGAPRDGVSGSFGTAGIRCVEQLLAKPFTLSASLDARLEQDREELHHLTTEQFRILDMIGDVPRAVMQGAAGTGKTVIALEETVRAALNNERSLLLCYNVALAEQLRRRVPREAGMATVGTFHAIAGMLAATAGVAQQAGMSERELFHSGLAELALQATDIRPGLAWDTVVIDEAHDFEELWWPAIEAMVRPGGKLRAFVDLNQRLYSRSRELPGTLEAVPLRLTRNLRNTRRIHDRLSVHYDGPGITTDGPDGEDVQWIAVPTGDEVEKAGVRELERIINVGEVSPGDVAVLCPDQNTVTRFSGKIGLPGVEVRDAAYPVGDAIVVDTVRRFKGLERPVVILLVSTLSDHAGALAYVGMSRASVYLTVVCQEGDRGFLEFGTLEQSD